MPVGVQGQVQVVVLVQASVQGQVQVLVQASVLVQVVVQGQRYALHTF